MLQTLNVAILGCGRIGKRHAQILSSGEISSAKLVAVCDYDQNKLNSFVQEYKVKGFTDLTNLLNGDLAIDILVICTESGNHSNNVIVSAGKVKNIIVEKPMALTLSDANKMIAVCKEFKTRLFIVKQNRFNLPMLYARKLFQEGKFGKITLGTVRVRWSRDENYYLEGDWRGTWALDGGVISNQASHHVDILQWFLGDAESVYATGKQAIANIEAEDTCLAIIRFKSGALGLIEATTATRPIDLEGSFSLLGEKGSIEIGGFAMNRLNYVGFIDEETSPPRVLEQYSVNPPDVYGYGHLKYYENVLSSILNGTEGLVEGIDGLKSLELISAIYESMEKNLEVRLPSVSHHSKLGLQSET